MDDWTYAHADAEVPDTQPPLLHEDGRVMEARRARAQQAQAAEADVSLPFATPLGVALDF